jgi:hypothetical protein
MRKLFQSTVALIVGLFYSLGEKLHVSATGYMARSGLMSHVSAADFQANRVTNANQSEIYRNRLYDYQLYPTAGSNQLVFFQQGQGGGITSAQGAIVGSAKTVHDTNMEIGGALPSGRSFLIDSIEVLFLAGSSAAANTYVPAAVSVFAAVAAAALTGAANDTNLFYQSGTLELNILSKNYLRETPVMAFPPKAHLDLSAALSTNSATVGEVGMSITKAVGRPYFIDPQISLQPAVNFDVKLLWPGLVPTGSGFNGRIGVLLDGWFMRASQ